MKRALITITLGASIAAAALPALAHHSFAAYDRTKTLNLKGTVKTFQWTNPHCVIWVLIEPEGGGDAAGMVDRDDQPGRAHPLRLDAPFAESGG